MLRCEGEHLGRDVATDDVRRQFRQDERGMACAAADIEREFARPVPDHRPHRGEQQMMKAWSTSVVAPRGSIVGKIPGKRLVLCHPSISSLGGGTAECSASMVLQPLGMKGAIVNGRQDEMIVRRKAFAYIVHEGRIVLLYHPDHPEAGIQVPAGTMEDDEIPEAAVLREAFEETGLEGLRSVRFLSRERIDMRPWGKQEWHDRWFFLLALDTTGPLPERWERIEVDPFGGGEPVRFELRWTSLEQLPALIGRHDRFLHAIVSG